MKLAFIVEGKSTEKKIYHQWVQYLIPKIKYIKLEEDFVDNSFKIISSEGYPFLLDTIKDFFKDVQEDASIDYIFICFDSEEDDYQTKYDLMKRYIKECPQISAGIKIIVQHHCLETFLISNRSINISRTSCETLKKYRDFYNVNVNDPEKITSIDERTIAQFTYHYLKLLLKEKGLNYSKRNTKDVETRDYFNKIVKRYKDSKHIQSFGHFYEDMLQISQQ